MKPAEDWVIDYDNRGIAVERFSVIEGFIREIQADAIRRAAEIQMEHPPSEHHECHKALLSEADRIEEGEA